MTTVRSSGLSRVPVLLAGLMTLISAATRIQDGVCQTLFLERAGARYLPDVFIVNAVVDVVAGALYLRLVRGRGHARVMAALLLVAALGAISMRGLVAANAFWSFIALYVLQELMTMLVTLHWGTYVLDFFDEHGRVGALPIVYAGARVGGMAGGLGLASLTPLGIANLLYGAAAVWVLAALFSAHLMRRAQPNRAGHTDGSTFAELRAGLSLASRSRLLQCIAVSTALMVIVRLSLRVSSGATLSEEFDEASLAAFLGTYMVMANAAGLGLQLLILPRLLVRSGVTAVNLAYSSLTLVASGFLLAHPSVVAAASARAVEVELKEAIKTPLSALFYGAFPPEARARARAFILALVVPLATVVGGLLLRPASLGRAMVVVATLSSTAFLVATLAQNRAYRRALEKPSDAEASDDNRAHHHRDSM